MWFRDGLYTLSRGCIVVAVSATITQCGSGEKCSKDNAPVVLVARLVLSSKNPARTVTMLAAGASGRVRKVNPGYDQKSACVLYTGGWADA